VGTILAASDDSLGIREENLEEVVKCIARSFLIHFRVNVTTQIGANDFGKQPLGVYLEQWRIIHLFVINSSFYRQTKTDKAKCIKHPPRAERAISAK
jgi:hypothetical protein